MIRAVSPSNGNRTLRYKENNLDSFCSSVLKKECFLFSEFVEFHVLRAPAAEGHVDAPAKADHGNAYKPAQRLGRDWCGYRWRGRDEGKLTLG